jgi:hypothetical protein
LASTSFFKISSIDFCLNLEAARLFKTVSTILALNLS